MEPLTKDDARVLMADLLAWPRREAKPEWWRYYERIENSDEQALFDDTETIAGLVLDGEVKRINQSTVWRYRFDPTQDCKVRIGDQLLDPLQRNEKNKPISAGTVVAFDPIDGSIELRRGNNFASPHPLATMPGRPIARDSHVEALKETAEALIDRGTDGPGSLEAGRRLIGRLAPKVVGQEPNTPLRGPDESTLHAAVRLIDGLDGSVLPVQGPPGSGKTYTAARVILDQVAKGRKIGITGPSHAAVNKLIDEVLKAAKELRATPTIAKKKDSNGSDEAFGRPEVNYTTQNLGDVVDDHDVVAGTSWAFVHPSIADRLDLLIVDEAGQVSLADVVAVARSTRNVALFGDPMQLAQPSKGSHPGMAGLSALEHLSGGEATVPEERGLLLDVSYRMHPAVCEFISEQMYDGRLNSNPACAVQSVSAGPVLSGVGLRWVPIDHTDNRTASIEEADAIATLAGALLGRDWTDEQGRVASIGAGESDILVVTPYNAQANLIRQRVPAAVKVGTVDMFQGREAPVVLVSLAASALEDIPRGIDFLLSKNRLNVAISRAKALCALVASPALLTARCTTLTQIKLVNTLCRYSEVAESVSLPSGEHPG